MEPLTPSFGVPSPYGRGVFAFSFGEKVPEGRMRGLDLSVYLLDIIQLKIAF